MLQMYGTWSLGPRLPLSTVLPATPGKRNGLPFCSFKRALAASVETPETAFTSPGFPQSRATTRTHCKICTVQACWCVLVKIGSIDIPFLVDTGASVNILAADVYDKLSSEIGLCKDDQTQVSGVSGDPVKVLGEVELKLKIQGVEFSTDALVAEIEGIKGIIGLPFLKENQCIVDVGQGTMSCQGHVWDLCHMPSFQGVKLLQQEIPSGDVYQGIIEVEDDGRHWQPCTVMLDALGLEAIDDVIYSDNENSYVKLRVSSNKSVSIHSCLGIGAVLQEPDPLAEDSFAPLGLAPAPTDDPVEELIQRTQAAVEPGLQAEVREFLMKNVDLFVSPNNPLGLTHLVQHEIHTDDAVPIRQPLRRMSPAHREIVDKEVQKMLEEGIIQESASAWSSPVVLVKKKGSDTPRFCVDFRAVNEVTRKDAYALANIQDCLDTLKGARYFATMDLASGFWQISVAPEHREKTAFPTRRGLFEFRRMAFGLANGPSTCQRLMEQVLRGLQWKSCLVYLDDVIVWGCSFQETKQRLQEVLDRLRAAGLKIKPSKCRFFQTEVVFLGHVIGRDGVACDHEKIEADRDWPVPKNPKQVRSFLGLAGYYRRFIVGFSEMAAPLTRLTKKNEPFFWEVDCQRAFKALKQSLISAPVLGYPSEDPSDRFILDTDASDTAIGCVLSQLQDGEEKVIAYGSKMLSASQRCYCVTYKELLAVVEFVRHYRHYLMGRRFLLRTDHSSLRWLLGFKDSGEGLIGRWLARLAVYDFEIEHRAGKSHSNADALSRVEYKPKRRCDRQRCPDCARDKEGSSVQAALVCPVEVALELSAEADQSWLPVWSKEELKDSQEEDPALCQILTWLKESRRPSRTELLQHSPEVRAYMGRWNDFVIQEGVLYIDVPLAAPQVQSSLRLVAAPVIRRKLFELLHNAPLGGHLGRVKTLDMISQRFYWPGCRKDVEDWLQQCDDCAQVKPGPKHRPPMVSMRTGVPWIEFPWIYWENCQRLPGVTGTFWSWLITLLNGRKHSHYRTSLLTPSPR